jgi:hypothetical protein
VNVEWQLMNPATHAHLKTMDSMLDRLQPLNSTFYYSMSHDPQARNMPKQKATPLTASKKTWGLCCQAQNKVGRK